MAFERAVQSLSFIEEKLRRAFNLAGPIGAALKPGECIPVIIAHDLREPGHSSSLGRCWAWVHDQAGTPAGVNVVSMLFGSDTLVEALYVTGIVAAGVTIEAYVTSPTETIPVAVTANTGAWRDRRLITADVPPISTNAGGWAALTGTAISAANRVQTWREGTAQPVRECQVMVPAGGTLTWRSSNTSASCQVGCWGRNWP